MHCRVSLYWLLHLEPVQPRLHYVREHPGELIHLDIKTLWRFNGVGHSISAYRMGQSDSRDVGLGYVHICIDDASHTSFTDILPNQTTISASTFFANIVAYYNSL